MDKRFKPRRSLRDQIKPEPVVAVVKPLRVEKKTFLVDGVEYTHDVKVYASGEQYFVEDTTVTHLAHLE